eukprot:1158198-Pelagomonas_calceolata.AAC.13
MPTCVTAVRIQWRYLAFELASGPGAGPLCMGPLCGDLNVEVQGQDSLVTSESVLEHILNATTNKPTSPSPRTAHRAPLSMLVVQGKTVLSEAATNGHAHVVALLLQLVGGSYSRTD